ncbi:Ig-like domain-containing protein [Tautonia sociabilis]|uniref:Bacterial Ig-like domain-containing protein n=1 Tax=Tautonia sociabilis TaxID=2080755 RepID=A0A432MIQ0_9BACT|nr:Ig-like domain-containing protein [Tautonia sociabilis]RUL87231.1 hypothetical protein TsocGM_13475 [Tautonia sociabilis]
MNRQRKRPARPSCEALETRNLLSAGQPTASWIGQDRHDFVGRSITPGPNGIQDVHIALDGLPADRTVIAAEVRGYGGDIWSYNGTYWAAAFRREAGSSRADLFIDPNRVEVGRSFSVRLWFDDGSTVLVSFPGGVADPTLRMPEASAKPSWIGLDGSDRVGRGPSVGPDGLQDAVIALANLTAGLEITSIDVRGVDGVAWQSGANPRGYDNAELIRDATDPKVGRLYVQPDRDLAGMPLTLTITYANGTLDIVDVVAGPTDPSRPVAPAPAVPIRTDAIAARWLGQTDDPVAGLGAVGLSLEGLPPGRTIVGAALSGSDRAVTWAYKASASSPIEVEPSSLPLAVRRDSNDPTRASAAFAPQGDEQGTTMTLRLAFDDGTFSIVRFEGGPADSSLRAPRPSASTTVARPGDDLQALVDANGTVVLSPGDYRLSKPLVLNHPVTITGEPGATLRFSQPSEAAPWASAILIHSGNTTLDGFAVRFDGPVRWDSSFPFEPAVIASTDIRTQSVGSTKVNLTLSNLDLEGPPASATGATPEQSVMLANLVSAEDGRVVGCRLRGGSIRAFGGPWEFSGNTYLGAMPGTFVYDVFAMSYAHDVIVRDNVASPLPGSGKTYRFLVLTQNGSDILVEGNRISGIGAREDDPRPHPNAPEVILTEAYRVNFEGKPLALSAGGTILQIPTPQGEAIRSGDVVAVLSGPLAGEWRRVAQVIDQKTLLLDRPLPTDVPIDAVSVSGAFLNSTFRDNEVDLRGSTIASPLVLAGAQFGIDVVGNRFLGGTDVRIDAASSERTVHWGWTPTPVFGVTFQGNTIQDSQGGLDAGPVRYPNSKSTRGRTYVDITIVDTLFSWSPSYFERWGVSSAPAAMTLGDSRTLDPTETRITATGNVVKLPPGYGAGPGVVGTKLVYNNQIATSASFALPAQPLPSPTGLRLLADTGASASDGETADPRIALDQPGWAVGLEYRLDGQASYRRVSSASGFLPEGLSDGPVTVFVRGIDDFGRPGPEASFSFRLDSTAPAAVSPRLGPGQDTGASSADRVTSLSSPVLLADGDPTDTLILVLLPDGKELGRRVGPGAIQPTSPLPDGTHSLAIRRVDRAGNATIGPETTITIDSTAPTPLSPRLGPGQDTGRSSSDGLTRIAAPSFEVDGDPTETMELILLPEGRVLARRTGPGTLRPTSPLADGSYAIAVRRTDLAGNATIGATIAVTIDTTPPAAVVARLGPGQDSGVSSVDGLTRWTSPTFQAVIDNADVLALLRDGVEVDRIVGSGTLRSGGPLADGSYTFSLKRIDSAGNETTGPPSTVTIDATAPGAVSGLLQEAPGRFRFDRTDGAVEYTYRVGSGPTIPLVGATSFRARGLPFAPTPVSVRAIDAAGNIGAEAVIVAAMPAPVGSWLGQRTGVDLVGPWTDRTGSDGIQDVAIAITGLPTDRAITSAEIRGWGSGIWQYNVAGGPYWKAAMVRAPGSDRAEFYIQPYQLESGRSYFVRLFFDDGTTVGVTIDGGPVDPKRATASQAPIAALSPASSSGDQATSVEHPGAGPSTDSPRGSRATAAAAGRSARVSWQDRLATIREAQRQRQLAQRRAMEDRAAALRARSASVRIRPRSVPKLRTLAEPAGRGSSPTAVGG